MQRGIKFKRVREFIIADILLEIERFTAIEKENVKLFGKIKDIIRRPTRIMCKRGRSKVN